MIFRMSVLAAFILFSSIGCDSNSGSNNHDNPKNLFGDFQKVNVNECADHSTEKSREKHPKASLAPYLNGVAQTVLSDCRVLKVGGYSVAGYNNEYKPSKRAFLYDRSENKWKQLDPMPAPMDSASATQVSDSHVLVVGVTPTKKNGKFELINKTFLLNLDQGKWSELAPSTKPHRDHLSLNLGNGKVFVSGSCNYYGANNPLPSYSEIYDLNTNTWSDATHTTNSVCRQVKNLYRISDDQILTIYDNGSRLQANVYSLSQKRWTGTGIDKWAAHSAQMEDGTIYVAATVGREKAAEILKFNPDTLSWNTITQIEMPEKFRSFSGILMDGGPGRLLYWGLYDNWMSGIAMDLDTKSASLYGWMQSGINIWPLPIQPIRISKTELLVTPNPWSEIVPLPPTLSQ